MAERVPLQEGFLDTIIRVNWPGRPFLIIGGASRFATGAGGRICRSNDGITWTPVPFDGVTLNCGAYGNGVWVLSGGRRTTGQLNDTDTFYISTDGARTFKEIANHPLSGVNMVCKGVAFGNGRFGVVSVTAGGSSVGATARAATSEDGIHWVTHDVPLSGGTFNLTGFDFTAGKFVICGSERKIYGSGSGITYLFFYNWVTHTPSYTPLVPVTVFNGKVSTSEDCALWSSPVNPFAGLRHPDEVDIDSSGNITLRNPTNPSESVTLPYYLPTSADLVTTRDTNADFVMQGAAEGEPIVLARLDFSGPLPFGTSLARSTDGGSSWSLVSTLNSLGGDYIAPAHLAGNPNVPQSGMFRYGDGRFVSASETPPAGTGKPAEWWVSGDGNSWSKVGTGPRVTYAGENTPPAYGKNKFVLTTLGTDVYVSDTAAGWRNANFRRAGYWWRVIY